MKLIFQSYKLPFGRFGSHILCALILAHVGGILSSPSSYACSAVASVQGGKPLVAANYDWKARGGIVFESPRGQVKRPVRFEDGGMTSAWTSRFASLTVSQFGRDFPMQGINEVGLMGVVLVAPAEYPKQGPLGVITEVTWLQYQLDQFQTVREVADHVADFGIEKISADLHWFLCDATGACILVEFTEGEPRVFGLSGEPVQVATNSPYSDSAMAWHQWQSSNGAELPRGYNSLSRFIRLSHRGVMEHEWELIQAIDDASLSGFTAFQTLFDLKSAGIKVRLASGDWHSISLADRSLECHQGLRMFSLDAGYWTQYDQASVERLFSLATEGADDLTPDRQLKILNNTKVVRCQDSNSEVAQ